MRPLTDSAGDETTELPAKVTLRNQDQEYRPQRSDSSRFGPTMFVPCLREPDDVAESCLSSLPLTQFNAAIGTGRLREVLQLLQSSFDCRHLVGVANGLAAENRQLVPA